MNTSTITIHFHGIPLQLVVHWRRLHDGEPMSYDSPGCPPETEILAVEYDGDPITPSEELMDLIAESDYGT